MCLIWSIIRALLVFEDQRDILPSFMQNRCQIQFSNVQRLTATWKIEQFGRKRYQKKHYLQKVLSYIFSLRWTAGHHILVLYTYGFFILLHPGCIVRTSQSRVQSASLPCTIFVPGTKAHYCLVHYFPLADRCRVQLFSPAVRCRAQFFPWQ